MNSKSIFVLITVVSMVLFTGCMNSEKNERKLRHVVLFSFNNEASPEDVTIIEKAFAALPSKIPEILDFEWGIDNSEEGLHKGFSHAFLVTFKSEEDRAIYLPHHDHLAFVELLQPFLDDVLVIDYWTSN